MVFRALLSPTSNPDPINRSSMEYDFPPTPAIGDRGGKSELGLGESEWPDFTELNSKQASAVREDVGVLGALERTDDKGTDQQRLIQRRGPKQVCIA